MIEFNNRVDLQRTVIKLVNSKYTKFELAGISQLSIERWSMENSEADTKVVDILFKISERLFFLANKSQEQITNEYKELSSDIDNLINKLKKMLKNSYVT